MTDTVIEEHAALLGRVTLAWNDCHYMSDEGWEKACATFFEQKYDHNRRGINA
jgi:hypothetical protein